MNILSIEAISKQYTERPLFSELTFGLNRGERVGVVGVNGSGKSSLLRIVAGLEPPDSGRVVRAGGIKVAYLPQSPQLDEQNSVLDAVFAGDAPTVCLLRAYEHAAAALALRPDDSALLEQLNALTVQMDALGAWEAEAAARTIISQLGLADVAGRRVGELSGGQRKRTALACALIERPDLLILDEPTNHIDTDTVAWLEDYLARSTMALLLVTHDRYFLERIVGTLIELDRGQLYSYQGNYEYFLAAKAARVAQTAAAEDARQNLLRRELEWLRRGARARTTKQKAHVERVYSLIDERPEAAQGTVAIDMSAGRRIGKRVLELHAVSKRYGSQPLIEAASLELQRNDRIGIIGPNGSGKTTLLNLIAGRLQPDSGHIRLGETVHLGYYDQEASTLDPNQRVIDYIREAAELVRGRDGALVAAGQMLERFLFAPEAQWALISTLSGGERRRLYLLRTLVESPNLLLLDEPTNDLDLQTLTVLEDYLDNFQGVVIAVSHDRYFLDRVVRRTIALEEGRLVEYPGGYSLYAEYRARKLAEQPVAKTRPRPVTAPQPAAERPRRASSKERRELAELETSIAALEQQQHELGAQLNAASDDYQRYQRIADELAQIERTLERALERWAELAELNEQR